jgi:CheY-like chemotaxis protein
MPRTKEEILIVDDTPSIRTSMSLVLSEIGYRVSTAEDGFRALREIRQSMPDIVLSDLNMPGMSGFELLSVIRQLFPAIHTIAMSGAFSGDEVPSGVAADAFFPKGCSLDALLRIIATLAQAERRAPHPSDAVSALMTYRIANDASQGARVTISCPECLRTFTHPLECDGSLMLDTHCIHCGCSMQNRMVHHSSQTSLQALQHSAGAAVHSQSAPGFSN